MYHGCELQPLDEAKGYKATLSYELPADDPDVDDGDSYSFEIATRPGGSGPLVHVEGHAHYTESQPNGPACGPTCESAEI